jgi:prepilin-type N-terminal cleavage/methylation domain-containing protein
MWRRALRARFDRRPRPAQGGFTLLEAMVAMLVAAIGLLGTVAFQVVMLNANANVNDGAVALRLASQAMEEFNARIVLPGMNGTDQLKPIATGIWTDPIYLDAAGARVTAASVSARWRRRVLVTDLGFGQPYNITVEIQYALDSGTPRTVVLDQERRK